ncbi:acetyl-CoA hydrolase/transferase family protein [Oceanibacterium hippocampi]|uniref:Succinyl-CoA:coenzyme A transferase n=1 Tax=Oceanibacterium hippocampi TaxID=745714 RepID=A0A1Y5U094_9PROT|nr:acetyl-CoA hydrolase/transferase C-terminal domain-containing protein [Oceanibacterium hippocampi]SLN75359.1 Succinyl-CoA:coenzyme A transferase [Oceanibacterium hippocampi]
MRMMTAIEAARLVKPGDTVFLAGCCGEPAAVLEAVEADPELWHDVHIIGAFIPGVNVRNYAALGRGTRVSTTFATPALSAPENGGRVGHLPVHYSDLDRLLAQPGFVDIGFVQVPPPRPDGRVSFGLTVDFLPSVARAGARLVALINPAMPDPVDGPTLPVDRFEGFVAVNTDLPSYDAGPLDETVLAVAAHVAGLIEPGDTLQLGLGKMQAAILQRIDGHRGLGFHGGMISTPIAAALRNGVFSAGITTGVALGTPDFYRMITDYPRIAFRPVGVTHGQAAIAAIPRFTAVNSVLQVDLYGQANAEMMGRRQVSGQGGLVDFVRGARQSEGGKSILALPSTASGGTVSRIQPTLAAGAPVTVARADADLVVTEFGVARLRHASIDERAEALISIANPSFRDWLRAEWQSKR